MDLIQLLEEVLNRELQDPRIIRGSDYSESASIEANGRIRGPEAIGHVVSFGSELHPLRLGEVECAGQGHVELPLRRAIKGIPP
mgnify:CR=1 FL=1